MKRDDSPRHQIQWDILGFIGLIVAALIAAGVAIWQTKVERSDDRPPAEVTVLVVVTATLSRPAEKPAPTQPAALPTPPPETPFPTQSVAVVPTATASQPPPSSGADRWACIHEADSTGKTTWETCWRYVLIDGSGDVNEASKESATAIEWIGPTDLTYTTVGQYHTDYMSEWYIWAAQKKGVRFCIDVNSEVEVEGGVERITAGCYAWRRGPFMVRIP
jgi:hypothetical protein